MIKFKQVFILSILCFQFASGQLSKEEIQQGYDYYNTKEVHTLLNKNLSSHSLDPHRIENVCFWINTDSIFKNFRSLRREYKKLDSVFSLNQKESLDKKFRNLESLSLEKDRLKNVYKVRDSSYNKQSFPVIQKSKDGSLYSFIYEEVGFSRSFGRLKIEKKVKGDWEIVGTVLVPRYDRKELRRELMSLPEEYQAINSYLAGKDDFVLGQYIPFEIYLENYDGLEKFEKWEEVGVSERRLKDHFQEEDLRNMVRHFKQASLEELEKSWLLGDLELTPKAGYSGDLDEKYLYSFSKPYVFVSSLTCDTYAVFYVSKYGGPLNGSGNIVIMRKVDGMFEISISHMLWIS